MPVSVPLVFACATLQICFGVMEILISFAYVDGVIALAMGATAVSAYNSQKDPVARAKAISMTCLTGLAIAQFIVGALAVLVFIIVFATVGTALILVLEILNGDAVVSVDGSSYFTAYCPSGIASECTKAKSIIGWIVACLFFGFFLPAIQLVLSGISLCSYNALNAIVHKQLTPQQGTTVTVMMMGGPQQHQQMMQVQQPQYYATPGAHDGTVIVGAPQPAQSPQWSPNNAGGAPANYVSTNPTYNKTF